MRNQLASLWLRISDFFGDEKFKEIFQGSALVILARLINVALVFIISAYITRFFGANILGLWTLINSLLLIFSIPALLGMDTYLLRMIPEFHVKYSFSSLQKNLHKVGQLVSLSSLCLSLLLFFSADYLALYLFQKDYLAPLLRLSALFIFPFTIRALSMELLRAFRQHFIYAIFLVTVNVLVLVGMVFGATFFTSAYLPVYLQLGSHLLLALALLLFTWILLRRLKRTAPPGAERANSYGEILGIAWPMLLSSAMLQLTAQTDVFMLGIFMDEVQVGIYGILVKLSTLVSFILSGVNMISAPKYSELFHQEDYDSLKRIARKSTQLSFSLAFPILLLLLIAGPYFLSFFGEAFLSGYFPLLILIVGQAINAFCGSVAILLNMTGHQKQMSRIFSQAALMNVALNLLLIPGFGLYGAAVASLISMAFWNFRATWVLYKRLGFFIFFNLFGFANSPKKES